MKKWIAFMLLILLTVSSTAWAEAPEEKFQGGDYQYVLPEDGGAKITAYLGEATELSVPAELDGHPVTAIGDRAFYWNQSLKEISIPDSVTAMGVNPFSGCKNLTRIAVSPDSAFEVVDGALFEKSAKRLVCLPSGLKLSEYSVPEGVQSIGHGAFAYCEALREIELPNSVTSIEDGAFFYCTALQEIRLPNAVTRVEEKAFSFCKALRKIDLSDSVTSIGVFAFAYCENLQEIDLPDGLTGIEDSAFVCCAALQEITIPDTVTAMGANPFPKCDSLTQISVSPDSAFEVVDGALFEKSAKRLVCLPSGLKLSEYSVPEGAG